jgi:hypothetical protein
MGYETKCRTRVTDAAGVVREADATVFETDELIVRGEARIKIPRTAIERATVRAGVLTVTAPQGVVTMSLGADSAQKWLKKIQEPPKRLIDKLDVKTGAAVWLIGIDDETLISQIEERTALISRGRSATSREVVFVGVESEKDLDRIGRAMKAMTDGGAIWVVHRKGRSGVADTTIFAAAKALGLTYTKVARLGYAYRREAGAACVRRVDVGNSAYDEQPALLLFDGTCGFCAESVQFVLSRERRRRRCASRAFPGSPGAEVRERHPELGGSTP